MPLARLEGWLERFEARHGRVRAEVAGRSWLLSASDGAEASVEVPDWLLEGVGLADLGAAAPEFAVLMVRRAGYAVGRFRGPQLLAGRASSRHIHGRTAAGGWSQQRYARRRENQATEIAGAAAAAADALPDGASFLVTGGDRLLVSAARDRLAGELAGVPVAAHLGVGTPTRTTLLAVPEQVLAARITVHDPDPR